MGKAVEILERYGLRAIEMRSLSLDATQPGDRWLRSVDSGSRRLKLRQHFTVRQARSIWPYISEVESYRTYDLRKYGGIGYHTIELRMDKNGVERTIQLSYNTATTSRMFAGGIAHFIDPRVPWTERRLTYKRKRGWSFPHRPYCNVQRRRADGLVGEDEGYGDYDDYD